ncbi:MAG TPA: O-antigen ligase family protein, partial [Gaiellaceae bacterium]|nr:O-antigen ligase family protein [Gaiellaceae bacterium]
MTWGLPRSAGALLVSAAALCAVAVLFGGGSRYAPLVWIGGAAVAAAAVGVTLVLLGRLPFPRLDGAGVAFVALSGWFVLWNGLSLVWSLQPDRSWEYFNRGVVHFAFLLLGLLVAVVVPRSPRWVGGVLLVVFSAALAWALLGKAIPSLGPDAERTARLRSPLDYWNALALLAGMTIPLALWAAGRREHREAVRVASVVAVFGATVALLLTYSRGGVVVALLAAAVYVLLTPRRLETVAALVVGVVPAVLLSFWAFTRPALVEAGQSEGDRVRDGLVFGGAALLLGAGVAYLAHLGITRDGRWQAQFRRVSPRVAGAVAAVVLVVGGLAVTRGDPVDWTRDSYREFTNPTTTAGGGPERLGDFGSNSRWTWWGEAWQIWEANPVVGTGAGTFSLARRPIRENTTVATEPHNLALQFLAETGLVGFLLATGAGVAAVLALRRTLGRLDEGDRVAAAALAVVVLAYLVHGLVDYDWDFIAVSAPVFLALGVLVGAGRPAAELESEPFFAAGAAVLGVAVVLSLASPWLSSR